MLELSYSNAAQADLFDIENQTGQSVRVFDWVDAYLSQYPFFGPPMEPPYAHLRHRVIEGRWKIIWRVTLDDAGEAANVVIIRVFPATSSHHI